MHADDTSTIISSLDSRFTYHNCSLLPLPIPSLGFVYHTNPSTFLTIPDTLKACIHFRTFVITLNKGSEGLSPKYFHGLRLYFFQVPFSMRHLVPFVTIPKISTSLLHPCHFLYTISAFLPYSFSLAFIPSSICTFYLLLITSKKKMNSSINFNGTIEGWIVFPQTQVRQKPWNVTLDGNRVSADEIG